MKRVAPPLIAWTALLSAAAAADLPRREAPPVLAPVQVFTWTGLYGGFNAGYAWSDDRATSRAFLPVDPLISEVLTNLGVNRVPYDQGGFTGGVQVGYNYQITPGSGLVLGIEADAQYTDLKSRRSSRFAYDFSGPFLPPGTIVEAYDAQSTSQLHFLGTVRGRVGYAWDRFLVYGTGGFAYGQSEYRSAIVNTFSSFGTIPDPAFQAAILGGYNRIQTGYAFGGGIEYALPTDSVLNVFRSDAVTFRVEYLRYDLGSRTVIGRFDTIPPSLGIDAPTTISQVRTQGNIVRAGVNYKFGTF